jgi:hypothetical protein
MKLSSLKRIISIMKIRSLSVSAIFIFVSVFVYCLSLRAGEDLFGKPYSVAHGDTYTVHAHMKMAANRAMEEFINGETPNVDKIAGVYWGYSAEWVRRYLSNTESESELEKRSLEYEMPFKGKFRRVAPDKVELTHVTDIHNFTWGYEQPHHKDPKVFSLDLIMYVDGELRHIPWMSPPSEHGFLARIQMMRRSELDKYIKSIPEKYPHRIEQAKRYYDQFVIGHTPIKLTSAGISWTFDKQAWKPRYEIRKYGSGDHLVLRSVATENSQPYPHGPENHGSIVGLNRYGNNVEYYFNELFKLAGLSVGTHAPESKQLCLSFLMGPG